jgi:rRNA maturation RNase YbeY
MTPGNDFTTGETPSPGLQIKCIHPERTLAPELIEDTVTRVITGENAAIEYLGIILANHEKVLELNRRYLGHDYETDVLSFPLRAPDESGTIVEGEIYVDLDTAAERAPEFDTTYEEEACRYVAHGLLHLLGYDDRTAEGRETMRALEERYV